MHQALHAGVIVHGMWVSRAAVVLWPCVSDGRMPPTSFAGALLLLMVCYVVIYVPVCVKTWVSWVDVWWVGLVTPATASTTPPHRRVSTHAFHAHARHGVCRAHIP